MRMNQCGEFEAQFARKLILSSHFEIDFHWFPSILMDFHEWPLPSTSSIDTALPPRFCQKFVFQHAFLRFLMLLRSLHTGGQSCIPALVLTIASETAPEYWLQIALCNWEYSCLRALMTCVWWLCGWAFAESERMPGGVRRAGRGVPADIMQSEYGRRLEVFQLVCAIL